MQILAKPPRLNYNVPRALVNDIRQIAAGKGIEPAYWLRKVIEQAIQAEE